MVGRRRGISLLALAGPMVLLESLRVTSSVWATSGLGHRAGTRTPVGLPGVVWTVAVGISSAGLDGGRPSLGDRARQELRNFIHNHIVRFPIALGLMGALLVFCSLRWPRYEPAARLLILLAALAALIACWTGRLQRGPFEGSELDAVLRWHERLGATTTLLLWVGIVVGWTPQARRWLWVWALLVSTFLVGTGLWGSLLAHPGA